MNNQAKSIIDFWFPEYKFQKFWFSSDTKTDEQVIMKFSEILKQSEKADKDFINSWKTTPMNYLSLIIVLDQFSRHIYRGNETKMHKNDPKTVEYVKDFINKKYDLKIHGLYRLFVLLPLRHSKDRDNISLCISKIREYIDFDNDNDKISDDVRKKNLGFYNRFLRATEKQLKCENIIL